MTQRAEGKLAGYAYLAYIVFAMSAAILSRKTTAGADTSQMLSALRSTIALAQVTVLLDLLQIVCAVVLAVTLYRLSRTVDATLALLAMAFRFGEGLAGFVPLLGKLELMKLATASNPMCASSAGCLAVAGEIFNRPDDLFGQCCFVVRWLPFRLPATRGTADSSLDGMDRRHHDRTAVGLCAFERGHSPTGKSRELALVPDAAVRGPSWDMAAPQGRACNSMKHR